ncbi:hypothetical protein CDAR_394151 [Caerostris darwini]|uniref:Uncharacterized protein n=1 Tax=Caerostris darwini TaxID=1538125 RepID=A0AAV4RFS9_9ARAC|nr:hypothetical protein CDAR_394151 [Caerostris darwini]
MRDVKLGRAVITDLRLGGVRSTCLCAWEDGCGRPVMRHRWPVALSGQPRPCNFLAAFAFFFLSFPASNVVPHWYSRYNYRWYPIQYGLKCPCYSAFTMVSTLPNDYASYSYGHPRRETPEGFMHFLAIPQAKRVIFPPTDLLCLFAALFVELHNMQFANGPRACWPIS